MLAPRIYSRDVLANLLDAAFTLRFDRLSNRDAARKLHFLEQVDGRPLTRRLRREADAYAVEVLGSKAFAPWLHVYAKRRGAFVEGWIPDNFFARVVIPNVNGALRFVSRYKTFTTSVFDTPVIPDVGYVIAGRFHGAGFQPIGIDGVRDALFSQGDEIIVKRDDSRGGRDVFFVHADAFDPAALLRDAPNAVMQRRIDHHPSFTELSGAEGSNLRIMTVRLPDGTIQVRLAVLRFASHGARIFGPGGGYYALVDHRSGHFLERYRTSTWRLIDRIPGASRPLGSDAMPGYEAARSACLALHARVPHLGVIGWDVMIDAEERAWVVEWNARHPSADASETFLGPLFTGLGWEALRPVRRTWLF